MRVEARVLGVCVAVLSSGCALGPNYRRPAAPVPPAYKELPVTEATAASWKAAEPRDAALRGKWWEVFGDPQLNALENRVSVSNQSVAQAEAAFRGARAAVRGARAELFPTVTTSPSVSRSHGSPNSSAAATGTPATITSYQFPIDLSYEADVWGRIRRNVEGSVASVQASAADLETVRLTMQAELAIDYFQLKGTDAQKEIVDKTVAAYEKALQLTVNRHDQGVASGVDVAQAETQLYATRAQATDLALTRAQLEHAIAVLAGRPPADLTIAPGALAHVPPEVPVGLPSELLERRPDIAGAERRMAAANAQVGVAKAAFFPRLLLSASGGYQSTKLSSLFSLASRFWAIGPALAATLFDGGQRRATREQAQASYDAAVASYRQTVLTAFQEVEDNLAALRILAEESTQQADAVAAAERSLGLAMNRYEAGITTYLEVITAQSAALANERTAVDVLTRRMTATVNLIKGLGGGWHATALPVGRRGVRLPPLIPSADARRVPRWEKVAASVTGSKESEDSMRPLAPLVLLALLAGPAGKADDTVNSAASSDDDIASFPLEGFDLASIKTFDFAPDVGSCLGDLTLALGPLGILAVKEGDEPDVLADCWTDEVAGGPQEGGKTLSVTAISLSDPRTLETVWWGFDSSLETAPASKLQRVIDRLQSDRAAQAKRTSRR